MNASRIANDMLRHRLCLLQKAVGRLEYLRSSRQVLQHLPRRHSPALCSQRRGFAAASRPVIATSRIYSSALATEAAPYTATDTNGAPRADAGAAPKLTFQEAITALEQYWAKQSGANCAILLPHNTEVRRTYLLDLRQSHRRGRSAVDYRLLLRFSAYPAEFAMRRPRRPAVSFRQNTSCRWVLAQ